jgi:hypothetical protein
MSRRTIITVGGGGFLLSDTRWLQARYILAQGARRENKSFKPGLSRAGLSNRDSKVCDWLPVTRNSLWSSKVCSAA